MQCSNVTRPRKLCELVSKQLLIKRKKIGNILVENLGKFCEIIGKLLVEKIKSTNFGGKYSGQQIVFGKLLVEKC